MNEDMIEVEEENLEDEIPVEEETVIVNTGGTTDHARLRHLDYESSGHTGFASSDDLAAEKTSRENADINLQNQIDAITVSSDVVDIVGTYQELQNYDTTKLTDDDIIKVMQDSTHSNAMSYYRWSSNAWVYVGSEGPFYTKSESDTKFQDKLVSGTNIKSINNISILGSGNLDIEAGGGANLTPLEVPDDYMSLINFINGAERPDTYTISNDNEVAIDIDKEETTDTIYISKGSIISVYPGWSATILTANGQYTYFIDGDYLYGGASINNEEVEAIIDEKLGSNVVMTNTDQTISGQKKFTSNNGTIFENGAGTWFRYIYSSPAFKIIPDNIGNFDFYYNDTLLGRIDAYNSILYRALRPNLNESVDLGSSNYNWNNIYAKTLVSDQTTKNISKLITNDSNLIPESNNLYSLGNTGYQWANLFLYNTLRFNPQSNTKIENLKNLTVNTINLGGQVGTSTSWSSDKFLQYDTTNVKYKGKLYTGLDVNNQAIRNIPDTPDDGTSPINKNYADTNLQDKLTAGTGIAITNNVISSTLEGIDYEVDQQLPQTGEKGIIYLIPNGSSEQENIYDEYIWIPPLQEGESGRFEFIGTTQTDLTNYVQNTDYATTSKGGVFKTDDYYGTNVNPNSGKLTSNVKTYQVYSNADNYIFISKGTLENVITGKELVNKTYVDNIVGDIESLLAEV